MNKPIIRHCYNCKWYRKPILGTEQCIVRYRYYDCQKGRLRALTCRFYKKKEVVNEERRNNETVD